MTQARNRSRSICQQQRYIYVAQHMGPVLIINLCSISISFAHNIYFEATRTCWEHYIIGEKNLICNNLKILIATSKIIRYYNLIINWNWNSQIILRGGTVLIENSCPQVWRRELALWSWIRGTEVDNIRWFLRTLLPNLRELFNKLWLNDAKYF